MVITIKDKDFRFGVRVGAIIFNENMTKVLLQKQGKHDFYMFPGGRLDVHEEAKIAIKRELKEELGLDVDPKFKYLSEHFIKYPNLKYHEIGFYFVAQIVDKEHKYDEECHALDEENDGISVFKWVSITELSKYDVTPLHIKEKIINKQVSLDETFEHITYREY